jgi:hypothetical protein
MPPIYVETIESYGLVKYCYFDRTVYMIITDTILTLTRFSKPHRTQLAKAVLLESYSNCWELR